jgi:hypothetical protein
VKENAVIEPKARKRRSPSMFLLVREVQSAKDGGPGEDGVMTAEIECHMIVCSEHRSVKQARQAAIDSAQPGRYMILSLRHEFVASVQTTMKLEGVK